MVDVRKTVKPISFSQFGRNFMRIAMTAGAIERALLAAMHDPISQSEGGHIASNTVSKPSVGAVEEVEGTSDETKVFKSEIVIDIESDLLLVGAISGRIKAMASFDLYLTVYCVDELGLKVDVKPIKASDIKVIANVEGLAGNIAGTVKDIKAEIAAKVADAVGKELGKAEASLYFDLKGQVEAAVATMSTSGDGPAAELVIGGPSFDRRIGAGDSATCALKGIIEDGCEVNIAARHSGGSEDEGHLVLKVLDEANGVIVSREIWIDAGNDFTRATVPVMSYDIGSASSVTLRVTNETEEGKKPVVIDVKTSIKAI